MLGGIGCLLPSWIVKKQRTRFFIKLAKFNAGMQISNVNFHLKETIYNNIPYKY